MAKAIPATVSAIPRASIQGSRGTTRVCIQPRGTSPLNIAQQAATVATTWEKRDPRLSRICVGLLRSAHTNQRTPKAIQRQPQIDIPLMFTPTTYVTAREMHFGRLTASRVDPAFRAASQPLRILRVSAPGTDR